jgi:putative PIN family toxin of toxin-antitoxin system
MPDKPTVVIDTQVLLDWLVFADARVARWVAAVETGELRWIACPAMRGEFGRMVVHPKLAHWAPQSERALSAFDRHAVMLPDPAATSPPVRCRDVDDQVFIDLALQHGARWLLTRDKALLALARRTRARGLEILAPQP